MEIIELTPKQKIEFITFLIILACSPSSDFLTARHCDEFATNDSIILTIKLQINQNESRLFESGGGGVNGGDRQSTLQKTFTRIFWLIATKDEPLCVVFSLSLNTC